MRMASPQSLSELVQIWSSKAIPLVAQVYRLFRTLYTSYMTQQLKIAQQNCETNCKENCLSKSKRPLEFCVYLLCQSSWLINEYCSHFSAFLLANPGLGHLSYGLILLLFYHAKARSKKYQRRIGNERHKLTRTATQSLRADFRVPLCLCFRTSLSAKPFLWKWLWFPWKWNCMQNSFSQEWFHT